MGPGMRSDRSRRSAIPRTVWALGLVSFFMDVSSEAIHALLPLFLTGALGASVAMVGLIDGVAESTAAISKVFAGYLSDRWGRRKPLILVGYGLGAMTKPLFAIAGGPFIVLLARFADRIGKGIRGAPRDALIADVTPAEIRGRAFGLRQGLDTAGAFVGPLAAIALMFALANDIRLVFWAAFLPALLAVACVLLGVDEPAARVEADKALSPISWKDMRQFTQGFWTVVVIGVVFTLARFSEAFLVLEAHDEGLPLALAPAVLVAMNVVYALGAYPAGAIADKAPASGLLLTGLATLILADAAFVLIPDLVGAFAGVGLWGLHLALTQGLLAKLVADHAPEHLRGAAFGVFNLATGLSLLFASLIAGSAWEIWGANATFLIGAGFAAAAAILVLASRRAIMSVHRQTD